MPTPTIPKRTVSLGASLRNLNGASETPAAAALASRNSRRDHVERGLFMTRSVEIGVRGYYGPTRARCRGGSESKPTSRIRTQDADAEGERAELRERRVDSLPRIHDVEVEEILPGPAGNGPRLDLRQVETAPRKHAQRPVQCARCVSERNHQRGLVRLGLGRSRLARNHEK